MGFDQEPMSTAEGVDEEVTQVRLGAGMKVEFGLFEKDCPT